MMCPDYHIPVMVREVLDYLRPFAGGVYVDCTLGGGGHTKRILEVLGTNGTVIGIDQDEEALKESLDVFRENKNLRLIKGNFGNLEELLENENIKAIDGCLFDLGVSSHQLDSGSRGFSFRSQARLDMRMDVSSETTAYDLVNGLPAVELGKIFRDYGDERFAGRIARRIESVRRGKPIETTLELASCIEQCVPRSKAGTAIHPATRVFMALRIAVNREMQNLEEGLEKAIKMTKPGGRIVVISYHSIEDRIVKQRFRNVSRKIDPVYGSEIIDENQKRFLLLTKKPQLPKEEEVRDNPRARSAKMRAIEIVS